MRKAYGIQWLLPVVLTGVAYRYRYRLLNISLGEQLVEKNEC